MRSYLALTRGSFLALLVYRFTVVFTLASNLLYIAIIYFLWRSIYAQADTINGLTFNQAFVYLALASSIFNGLKSFVDWQIWRSITTGNIVIDIVKPLDFQFQMLFRTAGTVLYNLAVITLPSALTLFLIFQAEIMSGRRLLLFPISLFFAFLISFAIDFIVGLSSFYTESLWGISMTKEIVVMLLSGALVPLQFFPPAARAILEFLPFQAIYHIPLTFIVSPELTMIDALALLGLQFIWILVLFAVSRLVYRLASRALFINGG